MGQTISIGSSGLQCIGAYVARPQGTPKGGLVIAQEIFGVNAHIRGVADRFATHGYVAIAPAFFDRVERDVELDYDEAGFRRGRELIAEVGLSAAVEDVASAAEAIASAGPIGCVGYCWGGTVAFLAATRLGLPAVSYYGMRNVQYFDETPRAPLMFHFGERDASIPPQMVQRHRDELPGAEVYTYPAGHGFNRDVGADYEPASAALALQRTLAFFARHLAPA
ncbi:dienelactone hydrolase family protein [Dokdonella sp.]|uniref:dienelactone hydrolase family protein n=1 Tax=Dokdonella sp. TaxID=2291710 RepID=UPI003BB94F2E